MAENEERLGGATTKLRRVIPFNVKTTSKSDLGCYVSSNPADVIENVIENVLCFLTSIEDRNAASLVCKSWYRAEGLTRLDVNIGNYYAVSPCQVINRFGRAASVTIKGEPGWLSSLSDWGSNFSPWVNSMTKAYPWLEKVYLKGIHVTNDDLGVLARSFPKFKEMVLVSCEGFGTRGLGFVARECRQIRVFELINLKVESDDEEDWISCFPESSTCLESFLMDRLFCRINFDALERLVTRSPSLKKLILNCDISIPQLHRLIVRAPQLTHLGRRKFGQEVLDEEQDYAADFAASKYLECLSGFTGIFFESIPEYLQAIVPVCDNLKSLDFQCITINAEELKSIICQCHKLETFWVMDSVGDEGLKAIAATCKNLRELHLHEENRVAPEEGLLSIFEGCRKLQYFHYDCYRMTNAALVALSKNCPDLRVLHISRIPSVGRHYANLNLIDGEPMDEGFGAILKNCKKITRLEAHGLLTDRAFQYFGEFGKSLQTLSFDFTRDSDMGLKYVFEGCSKLQQLKIIDCPFGGPGLFPGTPHFGPHHYYNMSFFLCKKSGRVTRDGCAQIARQLLDNFGIEAHVLAYMYDNPPSDWDELYLDYLKTYGDIKICVKRR